MLLVLHSRTSPYSTADYQLRLWCWFCCILNDGVPCLGFRHGSSATPIPLASDIQRWSQARRAGAPHLMDKESRTPNVSPDQTFNYRNKTEALQTPQKAVFTLIAFYFTPGICFVLLCPVPFTSSSFLHFLFSYQFGIPWPKCAPLAGPFMFRLGIPTGGTRSSAISKA
jgi:hypothetical protein